MSLPPDENFNSSQSALPDSSEKKRPVRRNNSHKSSTIQIKSGVIYIQFLLILVLVISILINTFYQKKIINKNMESMEKEQAVLSAELSRLADSVESMERLQNALVSNQSSETILTYDEYGNMIHVPLLADVPRNSYDWTCLQTKDQFKNYIVNDSITSYRGIDVATFQGEIDWQAVKNAGVDFAMIRLGYRGYGSGSLELDERFEINIKGATDAGIDVGVYFFTQAITEEEAIEEAKFVLDNIKNYNITYPIGFDIEPITYDTARTDYLTGRQLTSFASTFCETIDDAGYIPTIYSNKRMFLLKLDLSSLSKYHFWYASYQSQPDYPYDFQIWQYSKNGTVPGIQETVDLNICFVDYPSLTKEKRK